MLYVPGGLITRVRPRLGKPVLACSRFSSLSQSLKPVLGLKGPVPTTFQQRHLFNVFKRIKIGWLIGPPPKPGDIFEATSAQSQLSGKLKIGQVASTKFLPICSVLHSTSCFYSFTIILMLSSPCKPRCLESLK